MTAPTDMDSSSQVKRYSSRRQKLQGHELSSFLRERLDGALRYDRIAGYFCSSLLEVAGDALQSCSGPIRLVCNAHLSQKDASVLARANERIRKEWCSFQPERFASNDEGKKRFSLLYELLITQKLAIRIVSNDSLGWSTARRASSHLKRALEQLF